MNKKFIAIAMATILIFLGATTTGSSLKMSIKNLVEEKPTFAEEISLGSATVYGDGIEGHTNVDAITAKDLTIKITSDPETIDFYISYSMQCDGALDQGRVYLFLQLNGESLGNKSVEIAESEEGTLKFDNVIVTNGDILTYEIGALYANLDPVFTAGDLDIGAALILKSRTIHNRLLDSPMFQLLLKIPLFARLFT